MTEYVLKCSANDDDQLRAEKAGPEVFIGASHRGASQLTTYTSPVDARTFARGILALADEIDGGEATPVVDGPVKVGDRVVVTRNTYGDGTENIGAAGTLNRIDTYDPRLPYRVALDAGDDWWCADVRKVTDEPVKSTSEPVKVGDKLRVLVEDANDATVSVGDLLTVTSVNAYTFMAADVDGEDWYFKPEHVGTLLERVDEPTTDEATTSVAVPRRLALLKEAQALLPDGDSYDVLKIAYFLAGE